MNGGGGGRENQDVDIGSLPSRFLNAQPLPIKLGILKKSNKRQKRDEDVAAVHNQNAVEESASSSSSSPSTVGVLNPRADRINCNWNIRVRTKMMSSTLPAAVLQ